MKKMKPLVVVRNIPLHSLPYLISLPFLYSLISLFCLTFFSLLLPAASSFAQGTPPLCTAHNTIDRGPHLDCTFCHDIPYPGHLKDNLHLATTDVCRPCHSAGGQFNGVEDEVIGARANWQSGGVYEGNNLKQGKEKWCVGCHDEGTCVIQNVSAPNIAGLTMNGGDWQPPASVVSVSPNTSAANTLLDGDTTTGTLCSEVIFDLGDSVTISHIRLYTEPTEACFAVWGGNDLISWTRVFLGHEVIFAAPTWKTALLGGWNEVRIDKFVPVRYLKLVKKSTWRLSDKYLREFMFKRDLQYGYYISGHKMACTQCHDTAKLHIDGKARSYSCTANQSNALDPHNYQNAYRLKMVTIDGVSCPPLEIPRKGKNGDEFPRRDNDFALCFKCHDKYNLLGDASSTGDFLKPILQTNFYNKTAPLDTSGNIRNQHIVHLQGRGGFGNGADWDSDWNGIPDSPQSCPACHNVHGTPSPAMVRHGELISTQATDKTPSLNLYYLNENGQVDEKTDLLASTGGRTQFWGSGSGNVGKNGICLMCHNDSLNYLRDPVEVVSCITCHAKPVGSRRQITGEGGDFVLPSHHVQSEPASLQTVKNPDCRACHDQTNHTSGSIWLRNADGGNPCVYDPINPISAEPACLSCHDSDHAAPFSSHVTAPDIEAGSTWTNSAHATGGSSHLGMACLGDGATNGCHSNAHGSNKPSLLAPFQTAAPSEEGVCYACHNGQMAAKDMQVPFQKSYRHPIERSGIHQPKEGAENLGLDHRHAECLDCHNPHAAGPKVHTPIGNLLASDSVLKGVWGVEPVIDPAALPGQQIAHFTELKAPAYPEGAAKEYQICFKCHSSYAFGTIDPANQGVTDIIGPSGDHITDQGREFSPANRAAHPVVVETSAQTGALDPKGLELVQLKAPWSSNVRHQTMYCSDCHGTDSGGTLDAQGPHGSNQKFMLKDPSGGTRTYWPKNPDGKLWTLNDLKTNQNDWKNKLFCAVCHPFFEEKGNAFLNNKEKGDVFLNNVHQKGTHHKKDYIVQSKEYSEIPCVTCHAAVPHGTTASRLIVYSTDKAPYNYGGNMAVITEFKKRDRNSYQRQDCSTVSFDSKTGQGQGCHTVTGGPIDVN